jgi:N-acetyl-gamma-glutamyl-phosphate reductase
VEITEMGKPTVFIDGSSGTTGLRIREQLEAREDLNVLVLPEGQRRDPQARKDAINSADLVILCLPDDAAREAVSWVASNKTKVIDASTAHRVNELWAYGLPELDEGQRERVRSSSRVANPGCYPTGVILGIKPLVDERLLGQDTPLTVHALSGYTGGGKSMIARWEEAGSQLGHLEFESPYALTTEHKHIPEMTQFSGLQHPPQFIPSVGPFPTGMRIEMPLHRSVLPEGATAETIWDALSERYADEKFVNVVPLGAAERQAEPAFDPRACDGTNRIDISVVPNALGHVLIVAQLDNLGKGASGAAIQNLNLMLGFDEAEGLRV